MELIAKCLTCKIEFTYKTYPSKIKERGLRKYCNKKCYQKNSSTKFQKGNKHPFFLTGTYISDNQIRRSFEYIQWQKAVYKRDNYTCQICGSTNKLRANHIKRFSEYPELRFVVRNGIVICSVCDFRWVLKRENEWESYFNFNLESRGF